MSGLMQDLSFGLRQFLKHRVYALTAILSMALGIGAATSVYSVLYGVLIDPFPYRDANHIVFIIFQDKLGGVWIPGFTQPQIAQLRKAKSIEDVYAGQEVSMVDTDGELPQSVQVMEMAGNGFQFFGTPPLMGREFTVEEAPAGKAPPPVAVISYLFWKTHFASDPNILGRSLELNHLRYTVIGVAGPRFTWGDAPVYIPIPGNIDPKSSIQTLFRLHKGTSTEAAAAEMNSYMAQVFRESPEMKPPAGWRIGFMTLNDMLLGQFKGTLVLLLVAVTLLLLIGSGNVSILMLARGTARRQELATRAALGASRPRIARQLLTEAVLVSFAGGALGLPFAWFAIRLITGLLPEDSIPHGIAIHLNVPVLLFSIAISMVIGILAGLSPALQFSRPQISATIQSGSVRTVTNRGDRSRTILIAGQVALTVLLLSAAGAAIHNFLQAYTAQLGFDPHHVLTMHIGLPEGSYPTWEGRVNYYDALIGKIKDTPGITGAAIALGDAPPSPGWIQQVDVVGARSQDIRQATVSLVGPEYFSVLHIPLLKGRTITRSELLRGAHLAVINKAFAQRYFAGHDPIGRQIVPTKAAKIPSYRLVAPNMGQPYQIIGVVGNVRNDGLHRPLLPQAYLPWSIMVPPEIPVFIRTTGDPGRLVHAIGENIRLLNQNQAMSNVYDFDEFLSMFVWSHERFVSILFAIFSAVALGLASIGLFSVVAYTVEQRTREIGIRMALGAPRWNILRQTIASTALTTGAGLVLGILLSIFLNDPVYRWTESSMRNGIVLGGVSAVFLAASVIACLLPARRATRIDPMEALRTN